MRNLNFIAVILMAASLASGQTAEEQFESLVTDAMSLQGQSRIDALVAAIDSGLVDEHQRLAEVHYTVISEYEDLLANGVVSALPAGYSEMVEAFTMYPTMGDGIRDQIMQAGLRLADKFPTEEDRVGARVQILALYIDTAQQIQIDTVESLIRPYMRDVVSDPVRLFLNDTIGGLVQSESISMRQRTGRIDPDRIETIVDYVINGVGSPPYAGPSPVTQQLAGALLTSSQSQFVQNLLIGQYAASAQVGYDLMKAAPTDELYAHWARMTARVIRTADQSYNGRALSFFDWINGTLAENPVPDLVTE